MAWIKVDDRAPNHPKFLAAGPVASWLWMCGQSFCGQYLTDGHIPQSALSTFPVPSVQKHADILVRVGLWEPTAGGYLVHDYLDYQPSRTESEQRKASDSRRKHHRFQTDSSQIPDGIQTESDGMPRARARDPVPVPLVQEIKERSPGDVPVGTPPQQEPSKGSEGPQRRRKATPSPEQQQARKVAAAWLKDRWCPLYREHRGVDYMPVFGRDVVLIAELLRVYPPDDLVELAAGLLEADDPFINRTDRSIPILKAKINWLANLRANIGRAG